MPSSHRAIRTTARPHCQVEQDAKVRDQRDSPAIGIDQFQLAKLYEPRRIVRVDVSTHGGGISCDVNGGAGILDDNFAVATICRAPSTRAEGYRAWLPPNARACPFAMPTGKASDCLGLMPNGTRGFPQALDRLHASWPRHLPRWCNPDAAGPSLLETGRVFGDVRGVALTLSV
jgi:hypothetical protein